MKSLFTLLVLLFVSLSAMAQDEPQSQFGKDFLHVWTVSMKNTIDVAEAMPAEYYNYQPADSTQTFAGQIGHIAFTCDFLTKGFIEGDWVDFQEPNVSEMTKAEVVDYLRGNIELATARIKSMTEEQANETIEAFGGRKLKRYITVLFVQDHLAHHRAKANLYIRMKGIKPPAYAYFN
ncbi:MAG: DinB family protein [Bacteroidota bacterium]